MNSVFSTDSVRGLVVCREITDRFFDHFTDRELGIRGEEYNLLLSLSSNLVLTLIQNQFLSLVLDIVHKCEKEKKMKDKRTREQERQTETGGGRQRQT